MTSKRNSPPFSMVERDFGILASIARCGGLSAEQISTHHFPPAVIRLYKDTSKSEVAGLKVVVHANCQLRLRLLKTYGYIKRIERYQVLSEGKKPFLYTLTRFGAQTLASKLNCTVEQTGYRERETRVRPNYIEHHIKVNDIRLAFMRAVEQAEGITLRAWYDELELAKIHSRFTISVQTATTTKQEKLFPDACCVLSGADDVPRYAFIEYDGGTETTQSSSEAYRTFAYKMRLYKALIFKEKGVVAPSLLQQVYGVASARVLTITTSRVRRDRLREASEKVGCERIFWFASHEDVVKAKIVERPHGDGQGTSYSAILPNILSDPVWQLAKDLDETRPDHALDEPFKRLRLK